MFIPRRYRRRALLGALAAAVVAAAVVTLSAAGIWFTPHVLSNTTGAKLGFNERDWVLVADFENRTGEAVLDDTIRFALERELNTSQFVNVVSRERVADVLKLMRRPVDASLAGDVAREVSLRDGHVRGLVRGRIEKLGGTYVTAAELVDPATGVVVASFASDSRGQDEILGSVRELSNQLRTAVGEELARVQHTSEKLARVTTPSLRALQLFSQADYLIIRNRSAAAEQLLKQAIVEESKFASAYIHLAHAIRNQRRSPDEFLPYAERAMELADTAGDGERQFIQGSYYGMKGDHPRALASYQALLQLHPDHYWGNNNAGITLARDLRRPEDAVPYFRRVSELRPHDLTVHHNMAYRIAVWGTNVAAARKSIDRARALLTPELKESNPVAAAWIDVFTAHDRRLSGDVRGALAELQRLERALPTYSGPHHPDGFGASAFPYELMLAYQSLGRFRDAERVFEVTPLSSVSLVNAFLRGDSDLRQRWSAVSAASLPQNPLSAVVFARLGLVDAAEAVTRRFAPLRVVNAAEAMTSQIDVSVVGPEGAAALIAGAELAVLRRNPHEAVALYERGLPLERPMGSAVYFLGCEGLARVWLAQSDANRAIALLEDAVQQKDRTIRGSSGAFWLRVVWQLAKVYRQIGRNDDAARLETELRQLLAVADADHPILVEMQRSHTSPGSPE